MEVCDLPTITIKNIPADLYEDLKKNAKFHRRSINNEVILYIEQAVRSRQINADDYLPRIESLRWRINLPPLSVALLRLAKVDCRP